MADTNKVKAIIVTPFDASRNVESSGFKYIKSFQALTLNA